VRTTLANAAALDPSVGRVLKVCAIADAKTVVLIKGIPTMKTLQALTVVSVLTILSLCHAGAQSAEWIAKKTGNTLAVTKKALAAGLVFDPSDNSLSTPNGVGKPIPKHAPQPRFIYTYAGPNDFYRLLDQNGEVHVLKSHGGRFDPASRRYWFLTANGRWIETN
jgi:hypothetical protein